MQKNSVVYLSILIISACIICFEIVATRISSVIFVKNYAFIILSLAILSLGIGGIYSYYKININEFKEISKVIVKTITLLGISILFLIIATIRLNITNPYIFFFLLFIPFFLAGIVYSQLFKLLAKQSFALYAFDLLGAAFGSVMSIVLLNYLGGPNSVLFLSLLIFCSAIIFMHGRIKRIQRLISYFIIIILTTIIIINGDQNYLGRISIGNYPEKDFYHVYPDAAEISQIIDSRWSIYGRSDLVQYDNQYMVRNLFIDGAAGTRMYRFSGDIRYPDMSLYNLIINKTSSIPFFLLNETEKNNMLVIGPGGGKEILTGLLVGVKQITGVEINPDFVNIVKNYRDFNGGIYTDFPNVRVHVAEGRHYIKKTRQNYDLIVMSLPSTEQLQNIDNLAMSENYLLTVEAIQDYINVLTPEGRLIFTVHNRVELLRLVITTMHAFERMGIHPRNILNHLLILEQDYAPTIVIKKNPYTDEEIINLGNMISKMQKGLPPVTYLPHHLNEIPKTPVNNLLKYIDKNPEGLKNFIDRYEYNVSPCVDNSPFFYNIRRGIPENFLKLLLVILGINILIVILPFFGIPKRLNKNKMNSLISSLIVFICIGLGFMIIEISLFQKLILYLGSPTISLSILLGSLLVGMGLGSYSGKRIYTDNIKKRLSVVSLFIVISGSILFYLYPIILYHLLRYSQFFRSIICFIMIVPFGFLLGIPFPSSIQILGDEDLKKYIPWMYGVNGAMSVLGSVLAVIFLMTLGIKASFFSGLIFYAIIFLSSFWYPVESGG